MLALRSPFLVSLTAAAAFTTTATGQNRPWLHAPVELSPIPGEYHLLGDVDLDGDVDAISFTNSGSALKTSFTPWRNDGTGALTAGASTPLPPFAGIHLLLADVDGDGRGDLILTVGNGSASNGLLMFAGQAGGTFGPQQFLPLPGIVTQLDAGNGNNDGVADLLVQHGGASPGTRWIFGAASFALSLGPATVLPLATSQCVVDADGDGLDDVALPVDAVPVDVLSFHLTTPGGFVQGPTVPLANSFTFEPHALDRDGDGDRDVVVISPSGSSVTVTTCTNQGGGVWSAGAQVLTSVSSGITHVGDWNGDGRDDLGVRGFGSPQLLTLCESTGSGFVRRYSLQISGVSGSADGGAGFADLNQDGHLDFLDSRSVWFGDGTFTPPFGTLNTGGLIDWDGDGDQDLSAPGLSLHDGNGVVTPVTFTLPTLPPNHVYDFPRLVTDLDGDGRHEMFIGVLETFFTTSTFRATHLLREVADHEFVFAGLAAAAPQRLDRGVVDDTDGDGDFDVVNQDGLWLNDGTDFFTLQGPITTGYTPIAKGDVDGDTDQDLLATTTGNGTSLAILYRTAPNTWSTTVLFPSNGGSIENILPTRFFDVDDDGDLDVVARERTANNQYRVLVFTNQNGALTQALELPYIGPGLVGDVDGDGLTDLAVADGPWLRVHRRIGPGVAYAPPVTFIVQLRSDLVDFDQDGDLDATGSQGLVQNTRFSGASTGHRRQYGHGALGAGGWRPLLSMRGPIREGLTPTLSLRNAPGGTFALLILGSGPNNAPSIVLPGVQSYVAPIDLLVGFTLNGAPGQPGVGTLDIPLAIPPGLAGAHAFLEYVVFDPSAPFAFTHSNGCELAIGQ